MTGEQQAVLAAIANSENAWEFSIHMMHTLQAFNLPDQRDKLKAFLSQSGEAA